MKKILLSSLLFMATMAQAQTEENSVLVGGGLALQTGSGNSQFAFTPTVGYFFADNFVFGGTLNFTNQKLGNVKNNSFGIGPFARYYFGNTSTKPFVVGEFDFLSTKSTQTIGSVSNVTKTNGTRFLIGMGFAAFVNESVAVEGVSGYNFSKFKNVDGNGGFTLRFGFGIYFNRRSAKDLKTNVMGK